MTHATVFANISGCKTGAVPLPRLLATIEAGKPHRDSKAECPLFSAFTFGDKRTARGSLRSTDNALQACAVVAEHDAGTIAPELARDKLAAFGIAATVYTTASHTTAAPRWRIIAPTARPLDKSEYPHMVARLNGLFAGAIARESFTIAQSFYFGRVNGRDFAAYHIDGGHVDTLDELDAGALYPDNATAPGDAGGEPSGATDTEHRDTIRTGNAGVHHALLSLAARFVGRGMAAADAAAALAGLLDDCEWKDREPERWRDRRASVAELAASAARKFADPRDRGAEKTAQGWQDRPHDDAAGADDAIPPPAEESATAGDSSGRDYPAPRDLWKEPPPGPLLDTATALPAALAEIVEPVADARGHDVGAIALAVVCALSACLRQTSRIAAHPQSTTWTEGSALWGALIGESGHGKSPSMQFAAGPLNEIQAANVAEFMRAKEGAGKDDAIAPPARLIAADSTIEALGVHYSGTDRRMLNLRDEGSGFLNGMGRYSGRSDAERADWCSAWNCHPHTIDRLTRKSLHFADWGVSVLLGLTPSQMKEASDEARQDGLLARMLQVVVRPVSGREMPSRAAELAARDYGALARAVHGMGTVTAAPTAAAAEVFAVARAEFAEAAGVFTGNNRQMAVWLRKAAANSLRVALVSAAVSAARARIGHATGADIAPIVDDAMAATAVRFVNWSACHALAFSELNADSPIADLAQRIALFALARKQDRVTRRDLQQYVTAWGATQDERIRGAAILHLFDAGWLTGPAGVRITRGPGLADATAWHVNPVAFERFADYGAAEVTRRRDVRARMLALGGANA